MPLKKTKKSWVWIDYIFLKIWGRVVSQASFTFFLLTDVWRFIKASLKKCCLYKFTFIAIDVSIPHYIQSVWTNMHSLFWSHIEEITKDNIKTFNKREKINARKYVNFICNRTLQNILVSFLRNPLKKFFSKKEVEGLQVKVQDSNSNVFRICNYISLHLVLLILIYFGMVSKKKCAKKAYFQSLIDDGGFLTFMKKSLISGC